MFHSLSQLDEKKIKDMPSVALAFIGDAVHALFVRQLLATKHACKTGILQKVAAEYLSAKGQVKQYFKVESLLTEEEKFVFLRARNSKKKTKSKNATVAEYNISTGYEAVIGYLYLLCENNRLQFLLEESIK